MLTLTFNFKLQLQYETLNFKFKFQLQGPSRVELGPVQSQHVNKRVFLHSASFKAFKVLDRGQRAMLGGDWDVCL